MAATHIADAMANCSFSSPDFKRDVAVTKRMGRAITTFQEAEDPFLIRCVRMGFTPERARDLSGLALKRLKVMLNSCESPLERMMLGPLLLADYSNFGTIPALMFVPGQHKVASKGDVTVVPQFAFLQYRLDLAVVGRSEGGLTKIVALECDGQDYHRSADYEREKDALLNSFGVTVIHATGKEINASSVSVAERVAGALVEWKASLQETEA